MSSSSTHGPLMDEDEEEGHWRDPELMFKAKRESRAVYASLGSNMRERTKPSFFLVFLFWAMEVFPEKIFPRIVWKTNQ